MRVLVYIPRHGKTTDSDKHIFRGNRDSKLNEEGFRDAFELREFFRDLAFGDIYASDRTRSIQTGHIIGEPHDKVPYVTKALEPWRIGELTGKDKLEYGPVMQHYIDNPEEEIPGGESRNDFEHNRIYPLIVEAIEMGLDGPPPIIVGHSSIIHAAVNLINGDGSKTLAVKPGGIIIIYLEDGEIKIKAVFKKGKEDSSYAVADKKHQSPSS